VQFSKWYTVWLFVASYFVTPEWCHLLSNHFFKENTKYAPPVLESTLQVSLSCQARWHLLSIFRQFVQQLSNYIPSWLWTSNKTTYEQISTL